MENIRFIAPVLAIAIPLFVCASVFARRVPFYRGLIQREVTSNRFHAVDGLRGYLALGVVFHHVAINYQFYRTGVWTLTPSTVSVFFGRGSVAFFFMITAFLFWNRAIDSNGHLDATKFYISRLRRTVPMYLCAAGSAVLTALALTHFQLNVPLTDLARQVCAWLLFTIPGGPAINGYEQTYLVNTVFWSLVYEWKFYLLLPFLAAFTQTRLAHASLAAASAVCIWFYSDIQIEWFFLAGCAAAVLTRVPAVRHAAKGALAALTAIACTLAVMLLAPTIYSGITAACLLVPFVIVASGNPLFGLLTSFPARFFGLVSYSVYVLHNWVIFVVSRLLDPYLHIQSLAPRWYWMLGAGMAFMTATLSALTYRFIEFPYMRPRAAMIRPQVDMRRTQTLSSGR